MYLEHTLGFTDNYRILVSLEKEMAAHSRILAWRIPWIEEPGGLSPWGLKEFDMAECTHVYTHTHTQLCCTAETTTTL